MKTWITLGLALVIAVTGCSFDPGRVADSVDISGTVTLAGKPVGGVTLSLLPAAQGLTQVGALVGADGKFTAKAIPGSYTYIFEGASKTPAALKAVPAKYLSANAEHKVTVAAGKPIEITLTP